MRPIAVGAAIGGAAIFLALVVGFAVVNWDSLGNSGISLNGWIALFIGVMVTAALGVGLMALVFISSRRGYDEPPRKDY